MTNPQPCIQCGTPVASWTRKWYCKRCLDIIDEELLKDPRIAAMVALTKRDRDADPR